MKPPTVLLLALLLSGCRLENCQEPPCRVYEGPPPFFIGIGHPLGKAFYELPWCDGPEFAQEPVVVGSECEEEKDEIR